MSVKNYFISVGEPWDFESPDGKNVIKGTILKELSPTCIVFKTNHILNFEGFEGDILVLSPRHYESDFKDLNKGKESVTINGGLLLQEYKDNLSEQDLRSNLKFVIIGSLQKLSAFLSFSKLFS